MTDEERAKQDVAHINALMVELVEKYKRKISHSPAATKAAQLEGYRRGLADAFVLIAKGGDEEHG